MNSTIAKTTAADWLKANLNYTGDGCLTWPYSIDRSNGYGRVGYLGKLYWAHRLMCELVKGPPPSPDHEAAHSCGRGKFGCVDPRHLDWRTPSENQRDRRKHGTFSNGKNGSGTRWRLTPEKVSEIRALSGAMTQSELAALYGTTWQNIGMIQRGETWKTGKIENGNEARLRTLAAKRASR